MAWEIKEYREIMHYLGRIKSHITCLNNLLKTGDLKRASEKGTYIKGFVSEGMTIIKTCKPKGKDRVKEGVTSI